MAKTRQFDRDEAVVKARDLFWKKGYHATSMRDLEGVLSLRPGSIYAAFGSKDGLYLEAIDSYKAEHDAYCMKAYLEAPSALLGLAGLVRAIGQSFRVDQPSHACMVINTVLEVSDQGSDIRNRAEDLLMDMEDFLTDAFRKAKEQGDLSEGEDPVKLAQKLHSELIGLRAFANRRNRLQSAMEMADDIAQALEDKPKEKA